MDRTINVILKPLRRFAIQKPNASLLLFAATIVAMVLANSPWADRYHQLLAFPIDLQPGVYFLRIMARLVYAAFVTGRPYGGFLFRDRSGDQARGIDR